MSELDPETHRGGLLGHGEHPDRHLLCHADFAGPARKVDPREHSRKRRPRRPRPTCPPWKKTLRGRGRFRSAKRMVEHRRNPACASCHQLMGPRRAFDGKLRRDRAVEEPERGRRPRRCCGRTFPTARHSKGFPAFGTRWRPVPNSSLETMTEKLLTYALGRGVEYYDAPAVREIVRKAANNDYRFSSLVMGVVQSTPFQMRRSQ